MTTHDDVIVVGGGPAGALAALLVARAGLRVTVFDRAHFPRAKLCGDTVNPGGWRTLARHLPIDEICARANPIDGMVLTGPGGATVRGVYGAGESGFAIERRILDSWLLDHAMHSGARVEQGSTVEAAVMESGRVAGVEVRAAHGRVTHRARVVIAADGRHSRLAFSLGVAKHPRRPRRWAIGAYFTNVEGLTSAGEMHVRRGHYIGVAPMPGRVANACLVLPHAPRDTRWRDTSALLMKHLTSDPRLAPRFANAMMMDTPVVLGPMAVDARHTSVPGLLLAGDAGGFIDPMTGDGMTLAWRSAEIAAAVAIETLSGHVAFERAGAELAWRRRHAFASKWRFNRALRRLVSSPHAVDGAAIVARQWPRAFEAMVRYAGDVRRA